jgi:hypothetical protein
VHLAPVGCLNLPLTNFTTGIYELQRFAKKCEIFTLFLYLEVEVNPIKIIKSLKSTFFKTGTPEILFQSWKLN